MRKILTIFKSALKTIFSQLAKIYYMFMKSPVECNLCHYKANKLASDPWDLYTTCPNCGSKVRQRLLWAVFEHLPEFSLSKIIKNKTVLHFAPEKTLTDLIKRAAQTYKTADFLAKGYEYDQIDFNVDISNMPSIKSDVWDCVIACDVLEHVPNHLDGIKEVYRVLKKGGYCIFTVPQRDYLKLTYEDLSITDPQAREKAFGQYDHLRIYGEDFSTFLETCGFKVTVIDQNAFSKEIVERNVLFPPVLSTKENATNYRKVFIGVK